LIINANGKELVSFMHQMCLRNLRCQVPRHSVFEIYKVYL